MEEFLNKNCYITVSVNSKILYYLCSRVTNVSDTHITFEDLTRNSEPHTYRKIDIVEIKLSNKNPGDYKNE